jgi:inosine-uridine nucleoside N-ribohydrolase
MTNIAKFINKYPETAKQKITEIVFMGGSLEPNPYVLGRNSYGGNKPKSNTAKFNNAKSGNAEQISDGGDYQIPYAEFNINIDPDAVEIVLNSGIPLVMIPMELGHTAFLTPNETKKSEQISPVGKAFHDIFPQYKDRHIKQPNIATHDMCAVCYLTNQDIIKTKKANIFIVKNKQNQSAIEVRFNNTPDAPTTKPAISPTPTAATVATEIDIIKLRELYLSMLEFYKTTPHK